MSKIKELDVFRQYTETLTEGKKKEKTKLKDKDTYELEDLGSISDDTCPYCTDADGDSVPLESGICQNCGYGEEFIDNPEKEKTKLCPDCKGIELEPDANGFYCPNCGLRDHNLFDDEDEETYELEDLDDIEEEQLEEDVIPKYFRGGYKRVSESYRNLVTQQITELRNNVNETIDEARSVVEQGLKNEFSILREEYATFESIKRSSPKLEKEFTRLDETLNNIKNIFFEQAAGIIAEKHMEYHNVLQEKAMSAVQNDLSEWETVKNEMPTHLHALKINDFLKFGNIKPIGIITK